MKMIAVALAILSVGLGLGAPAFAQTTDANVIAGRRVAQDYCGMCHATGGGGSPLPNAPPFRELFKRYPPGQLGRLLKEGMLAPENPPEEGSPPRHPKMPMRTLGDDQISELTAYLTALDVAGRARSTRP